MPFEKDSELNKTTIMDQEDGSSSYTFLPEWRSPLPVNFGIVEKDIRYQKGSLVE